MSKSKINQETGSADHTIHWVLESRNGNVRAFELLYQAHFKKLFLFCKRMSGSISVAEELVQESFVKAWQALADFRMDSSFYTWLRTIASRLVIDRLRLKNEKIWQNISGADDEDFICQLNPEHKMDLEKLIGLLPIGARNILVLHEIEGYGHSEIAEMLGIAEGTSKAQLFRAKSLLRNNYLNSIQQKSDLSEI